MTGILTDPADRDCHAPVKDAHLVEGWAVGRAAVTS